MGDSLSPHPEVRAYLGQHAPILSFFINEIQRKLIHRSHTYVIGIAIKLHIRSRGPSLLVETYFGFSNETLGIALHNLTFGGIEVSFSRNR
jgi:hypothetical protein